MKNFTPAEAHLNTVLACTRFKDSYEAIKLLAQIKARQSRAPENQNEAFRLFKHVIELNPQDHESNFEIAALFEESDAKRALFYYEQGVRIMRDHLSSDTEAQARKFKFMQPWPSSFSSPLEHRELS